MYANLKVLSGIASIFRLKINGMTDEATQLEKKQQIIAIKTMNVTETRHDELFALRASTLAKELFEAEQYGEVPDVAECGLDLLQKWKIYIEVMIELQLILGKAKYHNGRKAESIKNLKEVIRTVVYDHPEYQEMAREACKYMVAQSQFDGGCTLVIWGDFKGIILFFIYVCYV